MIQRGRIFLLLLLCFVAFYSVACSAQLVSPGILHVTLQGRVEYHQQNSWFIVDAGGVARLYQDVQKLPKFDDWPAYGGLGPECVSSYALDFSTGTRSLGQYTFFIPPCFSVVAESSNKPYFVTDAFQSDLAALLHVPVKQLREPY